MRRNEREIKDREEMEAIIQRAQVCRIGLSEKDVPYIVPMDFGYKGNCLYFHCASEGKKLDMIRQNSKVCFEIGIDHQMVKPARRKKPPKSYLDESLVPGYFERIRPR